jgi:hypothetical protein
MYCLLLSTALLYGIYFVKVLVSSTLLQSSKLSAELSSGGLYGYQISPNLVPIWYQLLFTRLFHIAL